MMFAGLDVAYGDVVVVEAVDPRSLIQYTVIGEIRSLGAAGDTKSIMIKSKDTKTLIGEKRVRRIAFLNEEPPLLISIWEE
jgi:hypothetical protein